MERSEPSAAAAIRRAVQKEFNKFTWAPWATSYCMWQTGKDKRLDVVRGNTVGQGVHLCINPKFRGVLTWEVIFCLIVNASRFQFFILRSVFCPRHFK